MNEAAELARLDAIVEAELAISRAQGAAISKEAEDVFRLGFVSGLHYVFRNAAAKEGKQGAGDHPGDFQP